MAYLQLICKFAYKKLSKCSILEVQYPFESVFRQELRRFMRQVKRQNPEKTCFLEYDKLYVDHKPYVWNEVNSNIIAIYDIDELL